jgi:hypothetical protein
VNDRFVRMSTNPGGHPCTTEMNSRKIHKKRDSWKHFHVARCIKVHWKCTIPCCVLHRQPKLSKIMSLPSSRRAIASNSKQVCEYFYIESGPEGEWKCRKCGNVKAKNGGWTNLLNHLKSCLGKSYMETFLEAKRSQKSQQMSHFTGQHVSNAEKEVFEWIEFIVMKNLPMMFVDCPFTRRMCRAKPISSKTLRRHIMSLVALEKIQEVLPDKFVLVFDGWTEGTEHYIGVSASYNRVQNGKDVAVQTLLSMQPLLANGIEGMTADDHITHISKVLQRYDKKCGNVLSLCGDNCNVNGKIASTIKVPLLGCGSHNFNLAVRQWIEDQPQLIQALSSVSKVMERQVLLSCRQCSGSTQHTKWLKKMIRDGVQLFKCLIDI